MKEPSIDFLYLPVTHDQYFLNECVFCLVDVVVFKMLFGQDSFFVLLYLLLILLLSDRQETTSRSQGMEDGFEIEITQFVKGAKSKIVIFFFAHPS